jgi:SSS family solute:Na+ symporter
MFGLHWIDLAVLAIYFLVVFYTGVILGGKKTHSLGDYFVAGGKWGAVVSFIFIFASAIGGNEAVVVAKGGYESGLAGVWYWWSFLIVTPVYYLLSTYYRRARVYNMSEFIEMRFGQGVSVLYSLFAGILCILFIGMVILAIAKILAGMVHFHPDFQTNVQVCVWLIAIVVGAYVYSGGMMSALLTDIFQGLMCLFILGVIGLPFLWSEAGGFEALKRLPPETWNMTSEGMTLSTILALNLAALTGGIAGPWIYNWIAISKNEKAATQCGWGHLWKRIVTLLFAFYGILFLLYNVNVLSASNPELSALVANDPELSWGIIMKQILPVGILGLLITSFFAAAMSTIDTYAATSSAMFVDFLYRRVVSRGRDWRHYLKCARVWSVLSILVAALSTMFITNIGDYIQLTFNLVTFLGIPIYFGLVWRKSNRAGAWAAIILGALSYLMVVAYVMMTQDLDSIFKAIGPAFEPSVFLSVGIAITAMLIGSYIGRPEEEQLIQRFHVIVNTPVGAEQRLVDAGIRLPAMVDAGLIPESGEERINPAVLSRLYAEDCQDKYLGAGSSIELKREPTLPWYIPGLIRITICCISLVVATWLIPKILF